MPVPIQNEQAHADFKNGILTLTLPKVTEARHTVVKLNLADSSNGAKELNAQAATETSNAALN